MIRVALVNEGVLGGIRTHFLNIARYLDKDRFQLTVIFSKRKDYDSEGDTAAELSELGANCILIPMVRELSPMLDLQSYRALQDLLPWYDVIHAHSAKAGFLSRSVCRSHPRLPCYYSPHVFPFQRTTRLRAAIYSRLERLAAPWTTAFIVNSESESQFAIQQGLATKERVIVVPNAVERPTPTPSAREEIRRSQNTPEDCVVFLTVGRLIAYKGHATLLKAFAKMRKETPKVELWIAGEGEEKNALIQLTQQLNLSDAVKFLGYRKDVIDLLSASDCFVLASQSEGSPYTIFEALSLEKPVIATAVPGILDLLKFAGNSKTVPWNDVQALADAMLQFARKPFPGTPIQALPPDWFDVPGQIRKLEQIYVVRHGDTETRR